MLSSLYSARARRDADGFTLIELLVVVIIIGLLAAIALPIFIDQTKTAVDASVKADVRNTVTNVTNAQAQATTFPTSVKAAVSDANTSIALVATTTEVATKGSATSTLGNVPKLGESYSVHGWNPNGKVYLGTADSGKGAFSFNSTTGLFTQASGVAPTAGATADPGGSGSTGGGSTPTYTTLRTYTFGTGAEGWGVNGNGGTSALTTYNNSGALFGRADGTTSTLSLRGPSEISFIADKTYKVSAMIYIPSASTPVKANLIVGGSGLTGFFSSDVTTVGSAQQVSFTFVANSSATGFVQVWLKTSSGSALPSGSIIVIDDVTVSQAN